MNRFIKLVIVFGVLICLLMVGCSIQLGISFTWDSDYMAATYENLIVVDSILWYCGPLGEYPVLKVWESGGLMRVCIQDHGFVVVYDKMD